MTLWVLAALLLQPPLPTIKLPVEVKAETGDFVVIRAETVGKVVRWKALDPGLSVLPSDLLKDDRSFVAVAKKPNAKIRVIAWTAVGDVPSDAAECVVVIGTPAPPGPTPDPIPVPTPVPIDERLGFATLARDELKKVTPVEERNKAAALASNFEGVSGQLAAGGFQSIDDANLALVNRNRVTIGGEGSPGRAAWLPFFQAWQMKADALQPTKENYVQAYKETAQGLRYVGGQH